MLTGEFKTADSESGAGRAGPTIAGEDPLATATIMPAPSDSGTHSGLSNLPETRYYRSIAWVGVQAAEALVHAQAQAILHRDIKPSNLLLDVHGTLWITDFGLAKAQDSEDLTHSGEIIGTLRYMPPERFEGKGDVRSDVYALGVTLYEMLTLTPPFTGGDRVKLMAQITCDTPPPASQLRRYCLVTWKPSFRRRCTGILRHATRQPATWRKTCAAFWRIGRSRPAATPPPSAWPAGAGAIRPLRLCSLPFPCCSSV